MLTTWIRGAVRLQGRNIVWRGPLPNLAGTGPDAVMHPDQEQLVASNLASFIRDNLTEDHQALVSIHPGLRHVVVHIDGALALTCTFEDLLAGPGVSLN